MESKKRWIISGLVISGLVLTAVLAGYGIIIVHKRLTEIKEFVEEIKTDDFCIDNLYAIGNMIDQYQAEFDGANPADLDILYEKHQRQKGGCNYIYRGADLNDKAPKEMVLAYDQPGNHEGHRNVLFAGEIRKYMIDNKELTEEEYRKACVRILREYDPWDLELHIGKNRRMRWDDTGVSPEEYRIQHEKILNEYESGEMTPESLTIQVKTGQADVWERKADIKNIRVKKIRNQDFEALIRRDNETREQLGLPQRPG